MVDLPAVAHHRCLVFSPWMIIRAPVLDLVGHFLFLGFFRALSCIPSSFRDLSTDANRAKNCIIVLSEEPLFAWGSFFFPQPFWTPSFSLPFLPIGLPPHMQPPMAALKTQAAFTGVFPCRWERTFLPLFPMLPLLFTVLFQLRLFSHANDVFVA